MKRYRDPRSDSESSPPTALSEGEEELERYGVDQHQAKMALGAKSIQAVSAPTSNSTSCQHTSSALFELI